MTHARPRTGRVARRGALAAAVASLLTTIAVAGGAAAAPSAVPAVAAASTDAECDAPSGAGHARVKAGSRASEPNELSSAEVATAERRFSSRMRSKRISANRIAVYPPVVVPVVVHVITPTAGGGATDAQVRRQISVLNQAFAGRVNGPSPRTLFRFRLLEITRTVNPDWYQWTDEVGDSADDTEAKTFLHRGGKNTLNMYVTGLDPYLGYATFPDDNAGKRDGVVLLDETLPGGTAAPYNRGDTATHEVGHWLGLYHTFQDGCSTLGDRVADTPAQFDDSATGDGVYTCDPTLDTCANAPGRDPIYNFMNYVDDACMNRFTTGQAKRMALQWYSYRQPAGQP